MYDGLEIWQQPLATEHELNSKHGSSSKSVRSNIFFSLLTKTQFTIFSNYKRKSGERIEVLKFYICETSGVVHM